MWGQNYRRLKQVTDRLGFTTEEKPEIIKENKKVKKNYIKI